jgi:hypothetical protein
MLFHNVLDYKLWAFEHLWAPGALKTVEERATLHSHVVPFGDAALTVVAPNFALRSNSEIP